MCKTTQIPAPQPVQAQKIDRINTSCSNESCQSIFASKESTKRVTFQEKAEVVDTIAISDLSQEEIDASWLTDDDWDQMRQDFFLAKRKKCPSVEMAQPYRVSDRKAAIRYSRIVVKREESKFTKALQEWKENQQSTASKDDSAKPCWNCHAERVAKMYEGATRKSRDDAYNSGRRWELQARAQDVEELTVAAKPVESQRNNESAMAPTVPVPAC